MIKIHNFTSLNCDRSLVSVEHNKHLHCFLNYLSSMFANKYLLSLNLDDLTSLEVSNAMLQYCKMHSNNRCFTLSLHSTISLSVVCTAWALCALLSRNTSLCSRLWLTQCWPFTSLFFWSFHTLFPLYHNGDLSLNSATALFSLHLFSFIYCHFPKLKDKKSYHHEQSWECKPYYKTSEASVCLIMKVFVVLPSCFYISYSNILAIEILIIIKDNN